MAKTEKEEECKISSLSQLTGVKAGTIRYFNVDLRKEPTEYGFMPTMQMYLPERTENTI